MQGSRRVTHMLGSGAGSVPAQREHALPTLAGSDAHPPARPCPGAPLQRAQAGRSAEGSCCGQTCRRRPWAAGRGQQGRGSRGSRRGWMMQQRTWDSQQAPPVACILIHQACQQRMLIQACHSSRCTPHTSALSLRVTSGTQGCPYQGPCPTTQQAQRAPPPPPAPELGARRGAGGTARLPLVPPR